MTATASAPMTKPTLAIAPSFSRVISAMAPTWTKMPGEISVMSQRGLLRSRGRRNGKRGKQSQQREAKTHPILSDNAAHGSVCVATGAADSS